MKPASAAALLLLIGGGALSDREAGTLCACLPEVWRRQPPTQGRCWNCNRRRKPQNYADRRRWQDAQRAVGLPPECGREACTALADPAYVNQNTPLLYCADCAEQINRHNQGSCRQEGSNGERNG